MMTPTSRVRATARPTDNVSAETEKHRRAQRSTLTPFQHAFICALHLPLATRLDNPFIFEHLHKELTDYPSFNIYSH